jgi:hypothetical protein
MRKCMKCGKLTDSKFVAFCHYAYGSSNWCGGTLVDVIESEKPNYTRAPVWITMSALNEFFNYSAMVRETWAVVKRGIFSEEQAKQMELVEFNKLIRQTWTGFTW